MARPPIVLYYGPAATRVEQRWGDEAPFDVAVMGPDEPAAAVAERDRIDCVVCHGTPDVEVRPVIEVVRERSDEVPIVVVQTGSVEDGLFDLDVTHHVAVPEGDVLGALADLEPLIDRAIQRRRELSMLDSLLTNVPLSVYFKDRQSLHVKVSDEMISMIGPPFIENGEGKRHHHPEDVVGKTDFDLYDADLADGAVEDDRRVMDTEKPVSRIEHSYGEKGTGTYVATAKAPWYDDGRLVGILGVTRDISERKGYEYQLERQNERLERFATMVSHDIRNPLSVAIGRLDAARESGGEEHFDAIERSLERIEALVDDILRVTRQGESVLDPEPVSLADVAWEAWAMVDDGGATFRTPTEARILAEPGRLTELLENLFRNAVDHGAGESGDVADLTVTVGDLSTGDGFYVADDGVGVPPDSRETVFEPGISEANHTGIGLSLVTSIARAHNWKIELTDSDDGGTRFEFHGVRQPAR